MSIGTSDKQRNTFSAGLALGLAQLDRRELPGDKSSFDVVFFGIWRAWPYSKLFPAVEEKSSKLGAPDPWIMATQYGEQRRSPHSPVFWDADGPGDPVVYSREGVNDLPTSWEELASDLADEIPGSAWTDLARSLVGRLESTEA